MDIRILVIELLPPFSSSFHPFEDEDDDEDEDEPEWVKYRACIAGLKLLKPWKELFRHDPMEFLFFVSVPAPVPMPEKNLRQIA